MTARVFALIIAAIGFTGVVEASLPSAPHQQTETVK